jgi:hypothetical protein
MPKSCASLVPTVALFLCACGGDGSSPYDPDRPPSQIIAGDVLVFESRQSIQCGTRGLTTQQSAQKLINGGIDVLESHCGAVTGVGFAAVCGGDTGEILIHEIRIVNLSDAERLGFRSVGTLQDPAVGSGFVKVDCQTGAPVP